LRVFLNAEIIHEEGEVEPIRDMEIISGELIAKDRQKLDEIKPAIKLAIDRKNDKTAKEEMEIIVKIVALFEAYKNVRDGVWNGNEIDFLYGQLFLTAKPVVYLVKIGFEEYKTKKSKWHPKIQA
jgi:obg-like ATPase 1